MIIYLLRRIANYAVLLFIAVSLAYLIASVSLNPMEEFNWQQPGFNVAGMNKILHDYNIHPDTPALERYVHWLHDIVTQWNWGRSPKGVHVNNEVSLRVWVSLRLVIIGTLVGMVGGVALGAWTAARQYSVADRVLSVLALILISTPVMVLATLLQMGAIKFNQSTGLDFFEFIGETGVQGNYPGAWLVDRAQHLLLPTLSISLMGIASYSRYQRNIMLDTLGADYVRTARAKGLTKSQAVRKHALRNALIPITTYFAFAVASVVLGGAITERLFGWHGMGIYGVDAILHHDINGSVAVAAFSGMCVLAGALLSDILVAVVDPRVRS